MDKLGLNEPLENWDDETLHKVVEAFLDERFPTIVVSKNLIQYNQFFFFFFFFFFYFFFFFFLF